VFQTLCAKVVYGNQKEEFLNNEVIALHMLEKEFPQGFFDVMTHLMVHLVEQLFICGSMQCHWIYSMERYMKTLKDYVCTRQDLRVVWQRTLQWMTY
jgi:hypothetical protein